MNVYEVPPVEERAAVVRCITVKLLPRGQLEQLSLALVAGLVAVSLAFLVPAAARRLATPAPTPTPVPTPTATAPPVAVLLQAELERDLEGVMTIVNDHTFGTAFLIDPQGDFLTAASLVDGSQSLRLVDNTGGSHIVHLIGVDQALGLAEIRADNDGVPMPFGDPSSLGLNDSLALLASPKVVNLRTSTPAVITKLAPGQLTLAVDDLPGNLGGPIAGPGGKVLGLLVRTGVAATIDRTQADIAQWRGHDGTLLPLAPLPAHLILRGSDETAPPSGGLTLTSVAPTRASTAQETLVTIQGSGFVAGASLRVRFVPVASPSGAFDGLAPTLVSATSLTVKVPAGQVVQDYVIELTNGDGAGATSRTAFSVVP
jgi:hypothetical protein